MLQKYDPVGTYLACTNCSLDVGFSKIDFLLLIARTIYMFDREL